MITCLGLLVGVVDSPYRKDILTQCTKFMDTHEYLLELQQVPFEINGTIYATVIDTHMYKNGEFTVLFEMYDGSSEVGRVQSTRPYKGQDMTQLVIIKNAECCGDVWSDSEPMPLAEALEIFENLMRNFCRGFTDQEPLIVDLNGHEVVI